MVLNDFSYQKMGIMIFELTLSDPGLFYQHRDRGGVQHTPPMKNLKMSYFGQFFYTQPILYI